MNLFEVRRVVRPILFGIVMLVSGAVFAGPESYDVSKDTSKETVPVEKSGCQPPPPWEIRVGVPGWITNVSGDTGVKGVVSNIDVGFDQLVRHLTHVPIVGAVDMHYQRWELFGDGMYEELGVSASLPGLLFTNASLHVKSALAEGFLGYRLINCDKASLSLFAGARYSYIGLKLNLNDNGDARLQNLRQLLGLPKSLQVDGSTDWTDPVLGARGKIKVWKAVSLYAEGDVGGFDINGDSAYQTHLQGRTIVKSPVSSSDWSYQIQGGLEVQMTRNIWTQLGWRYFKYDYKSGGFSNETALNGPFIQVGIHF